MDEKTTEKQLSNRYNSPRGYYMELFQICSKFHGSHQIVRNWKGRFLMGVKFRRILG